MSNQPRRFTKGLVFKNISNEADASDTNPTCNVSGHAWVIDTVTTQTAALVSSACTVVTACNKFVLACHGLSNNQLIKLTTSCAVPTGLTAYDSCCLVKYYIVGVCANDFQVSLTRAGSAVALSATGTGTQTFTVMEEQAQIYLCSGAEKVVTDSNQVTLTNKTISGATNVLTCITYTGCQVFEDDELKIVDTSDNTKRIVFDVAGTTCVDGTIATAFTTAKTVTLPDATDTLVGKATTDTFTNKTIDANGTGNSISNLEVADLAVGVLDTALCAVSACDDTLASAKAIKAYADAICTTTPSACITHDCTTGFVGNEHIDHSGVSITAGAGLTGGGTIAATRSVCVGAGDGISVAACAVAVNITGAVDKVTPVGADEVMIADSAAAGAIKKTDVASLSGSIVHDCTSGAVANEHIDHSSVSVTAGAGLTGGGTIAANRTIDVIGTANEITVGACAVGLADNPTVPGTGGMVVSKGSTAQRGCATAGRFRYNCCTSSFEGYSSSWVAMGTDPSTTAGDILFKNSCTDLDRLSVGCNGEALILAAGLPSWAPITATPIVLTAKTTTYTALTTDETISASTSGGAWTLTLYTASGNNGKRLKIIKTTSDANALTIDGSGCQTINGNLTTSINTQYEFLVIVSDGTNWLVENRKSDTTSISFTPTGGWVCNTTYTGFYTRRGNKALFEVKAAVSGVPNTASLTFDFSCICLVIDTAKMISVVACQTIIGEASISDTGTQTYPGEVMYATTTTVLIRPDRANQTYIDLNDTVLPTIPHTFANTDFITARFEVPISGWKGDNE